MLRPLVVLSMLAAPLAAQDASAWRFTDVASESGIDFRYTFGDDRFSCILEDTGSGVALTDFDADGKLDVFLSNGHWLEGISDPKFKERNAASRSRLYRNLGGMKFVDVTDQVGITEHGFGMGAAVGDYDGDGDEDLYVLNWGANVLYRNDVDASGARRFTDVTAQAGLAGPEKLNGFPKWSVNGVWFDADRDGDLDLFVANYLAFDAKYKDPNLPKEYPYEGPESYRGQQSILYRNNGDGTFTDATSDAGLTFPNGKTMGAAACDFDGDGDLDLFEAMDSIPNLLWRNDGRGRFEEVAAAAGVALDRNGRPMASMHGTIGDCDGDGRFDLFVPNIEACCLYRNLGARGSESTPTLAFDEVSEASGLTKTLKGSAGWGSEFGDFDNDGSLDLLVVLGGAFDLGAGEHDRLFVVDPAATRAAASKSAAPLDRGAPVFTDLSEHLGPSFLAKKCSRGAAFGDLDGDGDLDYVVNVKDVDVQPRVMRNDLPASRHWLTVKLVGAGKGRDAIGAVVELQAGGRRQWRSAGRSNSYLSQSDLRAHFGLGASAAVDSLTIRWPSGAVQRETVPAVDRVIEVKESPREAGEQGHGEIH